MLKDLEAKNLVQFRLTGTPDGNLLVSFYQLDVFNEQAVNWRIASLLVENKLASLAKEPLYHLRSQFKLCTGVYEEGDDTERAGTTFYPTLLTYFEYFN